MPIFHQVSSQVNHIPELHNVNQHLEKQLDISADETKKYNNLKKEQNQSFNSNVKHDNGGQSNHNNADLESNTKNKKERNLQNQSIRNAAPQLQTYYDKIMELNFLKGFKFNTSLSDTDMFAINHEVYAFQWKDMSFSRLPFPTNITFYDCNGFKPEVARILKPLRHRFPNRKVKPSQMACPLHLRVIENNHYFRRFTRIGLEFRSPCFEYPIFKYIINQTGLRANLNLSFLGNKYSITFSRSRAFRMEKVTTEAFTRFRVLDGVDHVVLRVRNKYKKKNLNISKTERMLRQWEPAHSNALREQVMEQMTKMFQKKFNSIKKASLKIELEQETSKHPLKKKLKNIKGIQRKLRMIAEMKKFQAPTKSLNKRNKVLAEIVGEKTVTKLKAFIDFKIKQFLTTKNGAKNSDLFGFEKTVGVPSEYHEIICKVFGKCDKVDPQQTDLFDKSASKINQEKKVFNWSNGFKSFLSKNTKNKVKAERLKGISATDRQLIDNSEKEQLDRILNQEPRKLNACGDVCSKEKYYTSWNFCGQCGIDYYRLSNIDHTGLAQWSSRGGNKKSKKGKNGFLGKIGTDFVFLPNIKIKNFSFPWKALQDFRKKDYVVTCKNSWTSSTCRFRGKQ